MKFLMGDCMKRNVLLVFLLSAFSFLFFSCTNSSVPSVKITLPVELLQNLSALKNSKTSSYILKISFTGDFTEDYLFELTDLHTDKAKTFYIKDLPYDASVKVEATIIAGYITYYKTESPSLLTLEPGENTLNLTLKRWYSGNIDLSLDDISTFYIQATYSDDNNTVIIDGSAAESDATPVITLTEKTIKFAIVSDIPENLSRMYQWFLNGNPITNKETCLIDFSTDTNVKIGETNVISCNVEINDIQKFAELTFIVKEEESQSSSTTD